MQMKIIEFIKSQSRARILLSLGVIVIGVIIGYLGIYSYSNQQAYQQQLKKDEQALQEKERLRLEGEQKIASEQSAAPKSQSETAPATSPQCIPSETRYVAASIGLTVRSERSSNSSSLVAAPFGSSMKVGCLEGEWYSVEYGGKTGFSLAAYLSTTPPTSQSNTPSNTNTGTAKHPTVANCLPNDGKFTVYANNPNGVVTYWNSAFTDPSGIVVTYKMVMQVHCFDMKIEKLVYGETDSFVKASDVSTSKP
jgi:hypothetical protein